MSAENTKKQAFDTQRIHAGYQAKEHNNSIQVPIYQTTAFDLQSPERAARIARFEEVAFAYTRVGNPTTAALEARIAALEGGVAAVAVASGSAAVSYALLNAAEGGRVIASAQVYAGSIESYTRLLPGLGVEVDIVHDTNDLDAIQALIREDTKAIYIESITNPIAAVADIEAIANLAHKNGLPLIVDNTLATPYLLKPIEHGADVVVYSATKALSGHGAVIGGVVVDAGKFDWQGERHAHFRKELLMLGNKSILEAFPLFPFAIRLRLHQLVLLGAVLSPLSAFLILQGIETLSERVKKQSESGRKIAGFLSQHPKVSWVSYPTLPGGKYETLAAKYLPNGAGGIFSFGLKGTEEDRNKFINALNLFSFHANLGDARSLVLIYGNKRYSILTEEEQLQAGVQPDLVRLTIGLEDANDLIADLTQALEKYDQNGE